MNNEELIKKYGKLPGNPLLAHKKLKERKYFDSGDYALNKAGKGDDVGKDHPLPGAIPHHSVGSAAAVPQGTQAAEGSEAKTTMLSEGKAPNPLLRSGKKPAVKPAVTVSVNPQGGRSRLGSSGLISPLAKTRPLHALSQETDIPDSASDAASNAVSDNEDQK
ncbi:hypothetical protein IWW36_004295 [Coemansia brasiliensis]|uniref:mRNA stability protein n=1 Tax=Coemansia brasiliensis TaxID=2650707 RepID=A0A9W8I3Q5_9FUNG|nr:hypothetical protein IWW36_004295 [Coemansia brasiliensis]